MFSKSFTQNNLIDYSITSGALVLPTGTTAQRPANPRVGSQRWNTTLNAMEVYVGGSASVWQTIASTAYSIDYLVVAGGGGGGGGQSITVVVGDDFADDSPRKRSQNAARLVNLGLATANRSSRPS